MSLLKQRISSPLEAGPSILDIHNLPPHLTEALEYTSKRLARKALHITLVVVQREYQLPSNVPPTSTSPPLTPGMPSPRFASPVVGLKQLVRKGPGNPASDTSSSVSESVSNSSVALPVFPPPPTEPLPAPRRWAIAIPPAPASPFSPRTPRTPKTPMTPNTPSSITTATSSSSASSNISQGPNEFGIRLIHTGLLTPKAEKTLRTTILKAERKFRIGTGWLLPPVTPASACGLNADLVRRSILQNEVLFSSEGLTLLGLDRLYTFKSALAAYARSISNKVSWPLPTTPADSTRSIEDAVDSLRRLVLANGGARPVARADLHRSYDWLRVDARALRDVENMYRRAYGGAEKTGAFEMTAAEVEQLYRERQREEAAAVVKADSPSPPPVPPKTPPRTQTTPVLKLNTQLATATTARIFKPKAKAVDVTDKDKDKDKESKDKQEGVTVTTTITDKAKKRHAQIVEIEIKIGHESCSSLSCSSLSCSRESSEGSSQTSSSHCSCSQDTSSESEGIGDTDGDGDESMALPIQYGVPPFWNPGISIDELLSPCDSTVRQSQRLGPTTPNGYDDISPITRGEWGFLFKGDGWTGGRTAVVETC